MIIERTWTREVAGDKFCLGCKQKATAHFKSMQWIVHNGANVGRARIIQAPGCLLADWVEEWEDMPNRERATKRMQDGREAEGEFKDYRVMDFASMPDIFALEDKRFPQVKVFEKADDFYGPQTAAQKPQKRAERKAEIERLISRAFLDTCSHADLKRIRSAILHTITRRFKNPRTPKYGGLNRGFTEEELAAFFTHARNERSRTMFLLMRYLGLRIGEVVRLKQKDIDFGKRYLYLQTEKAQQPDSLYLHDEAYDTITAWINSHQEELNGSEFLFPGLKGTGHNSPLWLGKEFREVMKATKINYQYGMSEDQGPDKKPRPLNRLTSHSFRHTFIRDCWKVSQDPMIVKRMARHKDFDSTQVYLQVQQADMDRTIMQAFSKKPGRV